MELKTTSKLILGDCLEEMKKFQDNSIDLTVTSPPYDNLRTYEDNIDQWTFEKFQLIAKQLFRVTKEGGTVVWIVSDETVNGSETGTSFRQALFFKDCGFNLHDTMIWEKPGFTATGTLKVRYGSVFEYMFIFTKGRIKTFNPIKDRKNIWSGTRKHGRIRQADGTFRKMSGLGKTYDSYGQRFNVWKINSCDGKERNGHPAQFPYRLARDHIISWSNEGDTVFDPFSGSGTTGEQCVFLERNFIGTEICKKYYDIAKDRISRAETDMRSRLF